MTMSTTNHASASSAFALHDVYYMLFRHKWKIIICSALGMIAAAGIYFLTPVTYRSNAKLLIRYVTESAAVTPRAAGGRTLTPDTRGNALINTELHILSSQDVVAMAIDRIGIEALAQTEETEHGIRSRVRNLVKKLRRGANGSVNDNADEQLKRRRLSRSIARGLHAGSPRNTNVINIEYHAATPDLAQTTLRAVIDAYLAKHYEIHRSMGAYEFLAQQVDQTRSRLSQTEAELRGLIAQTGYSSAKEAEDVLAARRATVQQQIWQLEGELAGTIAQSKVLEQWLAAGGRADHDRATPSVEGTVPGSSLAALRRRETALLSTFTEDSSPIRDLRAQIDLIATQAHNALTTDIDLTVAETVSNVTALAFTPLEPRMEPELMNVRARIAAIQARIRALSKNLDELKSRTEEHYTMLGRIDELQRKKEIEESNYRYFSQGLEQIKIDTSLDAEKLANISIVQPATYPPAPQRVGNFKRNVLAALALGLLTGLGLAFFTEKIADTSLHRPEQVEAALSTPLLLTIPQRAFRRRAISLRRPPGTIRMLPAHEGEAPRGTAGSRSADGKSWTLQSSLKPYFEALRDRVIAFQSQRTTEEPCLLGIAGCGHAAGATTMAAGLALTLARNGDGRVLFIDLSDLDHGSGESLLDNAENVRLADIFADDSGRTTIMQPNLFVLSTSEVGTEAQQLKPSRRIEDVIAQLASSDYDYVVLDMPPIAETSPSLRVAPLISGVILVVESERVAHTTARKARKLLDQVHAAIIGAILNRSRQYVPRWLEPDDN